MQLRIEMTNNLSTVKIKKKIKSLSQLVMKLVKKIKSKLKTQNTWWMWMSMITIIRTMIMSSWNWWRF